MMIKNTEITRKRYNRVATVYDLMEGMMERSRYSGWRVLLWNKAEGKQILEVGVGTGKNFPFYPKDAEITGMDFVKRCFKEPARKRSNWG
jgi:phosphatidylethanolamine/phosphatidyl-N-methylethanolamine N-methyltransferase